MEAKRASVELRAEPTPENFKQGSDLSPIGFKPDKVQVGEEFAARQFHCHIADVWKEAGELELGGLYCLVDPSKMQRITPITPWCICRKSPMVLNAAITSYGAEINPPVIKKHTFDIKRVLFESRQWAWAGWSDGQIRRRDRNNLRRSVSGISSCNPTRPPLK